MSENLVISENYCNFKVLKIKSLQKIIAIITEDKVTEIFCIADDFCKVFDAKMEKYTIKSNLKRKYQRESTMSKAEIMVVIILFHNLGFRCLKHFYKEYVCVHLRHLFPNVVSYNRFLSRTPEDHCYSFSYFYKKVLLKNVQESISWIAPLFVYVGTRESLSIRHLKVSLKEANVLWDGSSVLSFI